MSNRFRDLKNALMIEDRIRDNLISYDFLRHFNILLTCSPYCHQVPITMLNCEMKTSMSRMFLQISVPIISTHDFLLKADPFLLTSAKSNQFCTSTYSGPNFVLFSDQLNNFCFINRREIIGLAYNFFQPPST